MKKILLACCSITAFHFADAQTHWPVKPTPQEIDFRSNNPKPGQIISNKGTTATGVMPADARFPGEFEESQAVLVAWTYDFTPPYNPDTSSGYAVLCANLADELQKITRLWMRVDKWADTTPVKMYMANRGTPLTNCRFFSKLGDDFWTRDYGPLGFYYSANDSIGFMDMQYYPGRYNDDAFPEHLGDQLGYKNVKTNLYAEGGNYMTDGFGRTVTSSMVDTANRHPQWASQSPLWTAQQIWDTMRYAWASDSVFMTQTLECDGGTGHIDMYLKYLDEQTIAIMEYPSTVTAKDKNIINSAITFLSSKTSTYNRPYRIFKMPMPTRDNGTYATSCAQINNDARTYVNGITLNDTYIIPTYSNSTSGNKTADSIAIEKFKKAMPGYKMVPIDSRLLTTLGGAVHCITMQIPAENPVRFWHPAITDLQPLTNKYHIVAKITNKSGIANATLYWRMKGTQNWTSVSLADSAGYKIGDITGSFITTDEIEYYISATSNNGKTMAKPIAAPAGFYSFYFTTPNAVNSLDADKNFALNPLPNPTTGNFFIPISLESPRTVSATVTDVLGKKVTSFQFGKLHSGMNKVEFNLNNHPAGIYFIQLVADGYLLGTKKIVKE